MKRCQKKYLRKVKRVLVKMEIQREVKRV